jgi:hypothetical protein
MATTRLDAAAASGDDDRPVVTDVPDARTTAALDALAAPPFPCASMAMARALAFTRATWERAFRNPMPFLFWLDVADDVAAVGWWQCLHYLFPHAGGIDAHRAAPAADGAGGAADAPALPVYVDRARWYARPAASAAPPVVNVVVSDGRRAVPWASLAPSGRAIAVVWARASPERAAVVAAWAASGAFLAVQIHPYGLVGLGYTGRVPPEAAAPLTPDTAPDAALAVPAELALTPEAWAAHVELARRDVADAATAVPR